MIEDEPMPESETSSKKASKKALEAVHKRALKRFDSVALPQMEMRRISLEDRRFVTIEGAMWEGVWGEQYENSPRPEIDKITPSLEKMETDYRQNRLTPDFIPGTGAESDTADTLDGMHRADSYYFKSQQARDNAFQEAIRGGFGAYRLTTDYQNPDDPDSDEQRVNPGMAIVDADQSVYFGPSVLYDKRDAPWAFIISADDRDEAVDKWGEENVEDWPVSQQEYAYDWYTPDIVRTAEYYEVEQVADERITFTQEQSQETQAFFLSELDDDDIKDLHALGWKDKRKDVKRTRVHKYILNGTKVIKDCGFIAGPNIPIVPVYFRRDYVDNQERWRGYVGKFKDRQRIYNASVGHVVETQSLAPYPVPILLDEQLTPTIAQEWADGNMSRHPFRRLLAVRNASGEIVAQGPIGMIEPTQLQPSTAALLQIASNDLTSQDDNADQVKANVSADAMDIAAARVDAKSGIALDNMRQSIAREGEIYLGMAREVCFEPGRKVETISMDGQDGEAELMQPHIDQAGVYKIRNDLARGSFKVVADVQESTSTARGKTVKQMLELAQIAGGIQDTELAQAALLNAVINMNGEGSQDMKDFARNKGIGIGLVKPTKEEQAQIQQAQEQQGQQPPAATEQAMLAQAGKLQSEAMLNQAKSTETLASAELKRAQAEAVGGPESAPEAPSGLSAANDSAEVENKLAGAALKAAQARNLDFEIQHKTIKTGHQIEMERRAQDHAERTSNGGS